VLIECALPVIEFGCDLYYHNRRAFTSEKLFFCLTFLTRSKRPKGAANISNR